MLGYHGEEVVRPALPRLNELRHDENAGVRWTAVGALCHQGRWSDEVLPLLLEGLTDRESPIIRRNAAQILGGCRERARFSIPALREALADPDGYVRAEAADALKQIE
jgi:hypothetical protein